jgi:REP element-mobilizing transposase RayT
MARGIERTDIFRNSEDKKDFINRISTYCKNGDIIIYAWALMPNHFHLLIRTGKKPLADSMRKILTGYVINFNRRYSRSGHLFQNRYRSIVCEDDPYLLELTRYIHLNPLRAGLVKNIKELNHYPFSGHSVIMGKIRREWQDEQTILRYFGKRRHDAEKRYEEYIKAGISAADNPPKLIGGGLLRSLGGWSEVIALRQKGKKTVGDERVLGRTKFVEEIIQEAEARHKEALKLHRRIPDLFLIAKMIEKELGVSEERLRSGNRLRIIVKARKIFCQVAVKRLGYSGAMVARYLNITTSAVNRLAVLEEYPKVEKILKLF